MSSTPLRPLSHLLAVLLICAVGCGEQIQATSSSDGDVISDAGNGAGADTGTVDTSSDDTAFVDTSSDDTNSNGCETQAVANPLNTKMATVEKSEFIYSTPPNSTGLVLIFHGGGGSKEDNLVLRVEAVLIAREAFARGYTVAALDSVAHVEPNGTNKFQWAKQDGADNKDVMNTIAMVGRLTDPNDLKAAPVDGPVILIGFSNGGSMASRVAQHLPVAAVAIYISNAVAFRTEGATIPPLALIPGLNDPGYALDSNKDLADTIQAAGGDVIYSPNQPEAVTPGLFTRIPGIDCSLSMSIRLALKDAGWLNADGMVKKSPKDDKSWKEALPASAASHVLQIFDVLVETYAAHSPTSDKNELVFDFLEKYTN